MSVVPVIASIAALLIGGFMLAPSARIETEIEIDAPPSVVWEILSDLEGHASWNPFLVSMQGKLEQGATLTNTMRQASGKEMTFRPTVLVVTPEQELRWRGQLWLPRLFDGEHAFRLTPSARGTLLVQSEEFRGIALWLIDVQQFRGDFEAMNLALKQRAEAKVKQFTVSEQ